MAWARWLAVGLRAVQALVTGLTEGSAELTARPAATRAVRSVREAFGVVRAGVVRPWASGGLGRLR